MIVGWALFGAFSRLWGSRRPGWTAGGATVITLAITTTLAIGVVALGGVGATARETGAFDAGTLSVSGLEGGVLGNVLFGEDEPAPTAMRLGRFALIVYALGSIGWVLEALITGGIISFVSRVRPALLAGAVHEHAATYAVGDQAVHH
jgi:hypothetical protein